MLGDWPDRGGNGCARAEPSKRDAIVYGVLDLLRAVEIMCRGGQVLVPQQGLNLLQLAASFAAEFGARAAQIMRAKMADPRGFGGRHHHIPDRPRAQREACDRAAFAHGDAKIGPEVIPAALVHSSRASFAACGIGTVRTRPRLPMRSAMTHRPSRR
jgi:hypothetical protein